ncbi:MAG: hypothetical protein KGD59_11905 [Candidatus Heimdallarchaeota archaeon]|nr:hypothetical protein [Candidatus Heimdallarchaeota archaeon]MBY8995247.1 hypothetical protein [Candidatus Heimdallarchaeota archaeon]
MRKKFFAYVIVSSVLIVSILISAFAVDLSRKSELLSEPELVMDNSFLIHDNTQYDFNNDKIAKIDFNSSYNFAETINLDPAQSFEGGMAIYGSIENATNMKHGVIELFTFTKTLDTINYQNTASYVDTILYNETNYLAGKGISNRYDGEIGNPMVALLKEIPLNNTFWIDFLEISSSNLLFNYTYTIPQNHFEKIFDFEIIDIDSDSKYELYVLGRNATSPQDYSLAEYSYNSTAAIYNLTNTYNWNGTDYNIVEMELITEPTDLHFVLTGIDIPVLETFVQIISINRDITRSFSQRSFGHYGFGSDSFRVYGMKTYSAGITNPRRVALFGSKSVGVSDTFPTCITIVDVLNPGSGSDDVSLNYNPSWSFDGMIVDIDYDGIDEIVQTTYDLPGSIKSDYVVLTSGGLSEVNSDTTELYQIKSSARLVLSGFQISSWIGKNDLHNYAIEFYFPHHVSYRLYGSAEVLINGSNNTMYIETTNLAGYNNPRTDIILHAGLTVDPTIDEILVSMPNNFTFDLNAIVSVYEFEEISLNITKGAVELNIDNIPIRIDYPLNTAVFTPPVPIQLRNELTQIQTYDVLVENTLSQELNGTIEISGTVSNYSSIDYILLGESITINQPIDFEFFGSDPESKYEETVIITVKTEAGVIKYEFQVLVTNLFHVTVNDLFIIFGIIAVLIVIIYIGLAIIILRKTEEAFDKHFTTEDPVRLDFKVFKGKALNNLIQKYSDEGNWKAGINMAKEFKPKYVPYFHKFKVKEQLMSGQELMDQGKFDDGLTYWQEARESLDVIGKHEWIDTVNWLIDPLQRIVEISAMKGTEKAAALEKEFQNLNSMRDQEFVILSIKLDIPLYLVAEELGIALRDANDLQASLNYLQLAYQGAPEKFKNRIVTEITGLISLGVTPTEFAMPVDHDAIRERIEKRVVRCYSCGEERTNINEICPNCGIDTVLCSVCKLPISFGSEHLECYHCQNVAHREHLLEWVKVKGTCPVCQQKLITDKLGVAEEKE